MQKLISTILPLVPQYQGKKDIVGLLKIYASDNNTNLRLEVDDSGRGVHVRIRDQYGRQVRLTDTGREFHQPILSYETNTLVEFSELLIRIENLFGKPAQVHCQEQGSSIPLGQVTNFPRLPHLGSAA